MSDYGKTRPAEEIINEPDFAKGCEKICEQLNAISKKESIASIQNALEAARPLKEINKDNLAWNGDLKKQSEVISFICSRFDKFEERNQVVAKAFDAIHNKLQMAAIAIEAGDRANEMRIFELDTRILRAISQINEALRRIEESQPRKFGFTPFRSLSNTETTECEYYKYELNQLEKSFKANTEAKNREIEDLKKGMQNMQSNKDTTILCLKRSIAKLEEEVRQLSGFEKNTESLNGIADQVIDRLKDMNAADYDPQT